MKNQNLPVEFLYHLAVRQELTIRAQEVTNNFL